MKYNHVHEMLNSDDIQGYKDDLLSYANMRDEMVKIISKARGQKRIYLEQILDVLDLTAEIALDSTHQQEIESEIYSILS